MHHGLVLIVLVFFNVTVHGQRFLTINGVIFTKLSFCQMLCNFYLRRVILSKMVKILDVLTRNNNCQGCVAQDK